MALDKKTKEYFDSLSDDFFISFILSNYSTKIPKWEKCSKEEYEKYMGTEEEECFSIKRIEKWLNAPTEYRRVPYWNNGGGILDQISGKEPSGYNYEKLIGYENVLLMGNDMINYCNKRKCMDIFFNNNKYERNKFK